MPITAPTIPDGLPELMRGLAKSVIKENPENIYVHAAEYFDNLVRERDGELDKGYKNFGALKVYSDYKEKCREKVGLPPVANVSVSDGDDDDSGGSASKARGRRRKRSKKQTSRDVRSIDDKDSPEAVVEPQPDGNGDDALERESPIQPITEAVEVVEAEVQETVAVKRAYQPQESPVRKDSKIASVQSVEADNTVSKVLEILDNESQDKETGEVMADVDAGEDVAVVEEEDYGTAPSTAEVIESTVEDGENEKQNEMEQAAQELETCFAMVNVDHLLEKPDNETADLAPEPEGIDTVDEVKETGETLAVQSRFGDVEDETETLVVEEEKQIDAEIEQNESAVIAEEELKEESQSVDTQEHADANANSTIDAEEQPSPSPSAPVETELTNPEQPVDEGQDENPENGQGQASIEATDTVADSNESEHAQITTTGPDETQLNTDDTERPIEVVAEQHEAEIPKDDDILDPEVEALISGSNIEQEEQLNAEDTTHDDMKSVPEPLLADESENVEKAEETPSSDAVIEATDQNLSESATDEINVAPDEVKAETEENPPGSQDSVEKDASEKNEETHAEDPNSKTNVAEDENVDEDEKAPNSEDGTEQTEPNEEPDTVTTDEQTEKQTTTVISNDTQDEIVEDTEQKSEETINPEDNTTTVANVESPEPTEADEANGTNNQEDTAEIAEPAVDGDDIAKLEKQTSESIGDNASGEAVESQIKVEAEGEDSGEPVEVDSGSATENAADPTAVGQGEDNATAAADEEEDHKTVDDGSSSTVKETKMEQPEATADVPQSTLDQPTQDNEAEAEIEQQQPLAPTEEVMETAEQLTSSEEGSKDKPSEPELEVNEPSDDRNADPSDNVAVEDDASAEGKPSDTADTKVDGETHENLQEVQEEPCIQRQISPSKSSPPAKGEAAENKVQEMEEIKRVDLSALSKDSAEALFYSLKKSELQSQEDDDADVVVTEERPSSKGGSAKRAFTDDFLEQGPITEDAPAPQVGGDGDSPEMPDEQGEEEDNFNPMLSVSMRNKQFQDQLHSRANTITENEDDAAHRRTVMRRSMTEVAGLQRHDSSYVDLRKYDPEYAEDEDTFDGYYIGSIKNKILASSVSVADSDYFEPNQSTESVDENNIRTALETIASTDTESTIASQATIQANTNTRRYLKKHSQNTSTNIPYASFGNAAIDQSLDEFIEREEHNKEAEEAMAEAATKIQRSYRSHKKRLLRDYHSTMRTFTEDLSAESSEDYPNTQVIQIKLDQKKSTGDEDTPSPEDIRPLAGKRPMYSLNIDEYDTAARRMTLTRGVAMQRNSTPDDDSSKSNNVSTDHKTSPAVRQESVLLSSDPSDEKKSSSGDEKENRDNSSSKSNDQSLSVPGTKSLPVTRTFAPRDVQNLLFTRQRSMPVQIEATVIRVLPKHMRKRISSAGEGKRRK